MNTSNKEIDIRSFNENKTIIIDLMKKNDIINLTNFIIKNNIILESFNINEFDLLIYGIRINISNKMLSFVYDHCHYKTINYTHILNRSEIVTPLFLALYYSNYDLAKTILEKGGNINYKGIKYNVLSFLKKKGALDKRKLIFILSHGFNITYINKYQLIYNFNFSLTKVILEFCIFNNNFILKLLSINKNKTPMSKNAFYELIRNEKGKFEIKEWYYKLLNKRKYKQIEYIYSYEDRNNNANNIQKLLQCANKIDTSDNDFLKYTILRKIEKKKLNVFMEKEYLHYEFNKIYYDKLKKINRFIKKKTFTQLMIFFEENKFIFKDLKKVDYDFITFSILKDVPKSYIKEVLKYCPLYIFKKKWIKMTLSTNNQSLLRILLKSFNENKIIN
ncbi:hypothetical protein BCR32DRAFT_248642 [Anaeromyces robustus]|uniref:Uncharacterized protein n=1 Tax=Anaeromyces robustus TaxID=1754192 RepID=A0A1Y1WT05_9FUNG|nr:hypothetical protein BCR32DRAFT_248642 [Anaeromyces robustus]|eukprot:ORX76582.1 hypothetical protein BCR32DRAFT_248642 [Anaeromyces robustus]